MHAGKRLLLITNSEWYYTRTMMDYAFNEYLPGGMTWRDLFEVVIVASRKPSFFTTSSPLFRVVNEEGLLEPCELGLRSPGIYLGGNASLVEKYLGASGDEILYVGDHIFTDVTVSKNISQWRTALVLRELESDLSEMTSFEQQQKSLSRSQVREKLMALDDEIAPLAAAAAAIGNAALSVERSGLQGLSLEAH
ncbi:MAG: 5'-nucleotidase domain-containing protein [Gemmatimonadales bacterium]